MFIRVHPWPFIYSYASASTTSWRAARRPGYNAPASAPTIEIAVAMGHQSGTITVTIMGAKTFISHRAPYVIAIPSTEPTSASSTVSRSRQSKINHGEPPSALRMPISRVRYSTAVYIERNTTRKPTSVPIPMITRVKVRSMGTLLSVSSEMKSCME